MKRILHTWDKWECYPAGFYENKCKDPTVTKEKAEQLYADFLKDAARFSAGLDRVLLEWPRSCEHYLSNVNMNRIAWLGQSACCIELGIPSCFRGGFNLLSHDEQAAANTLALMALNRWLVSNGEQELSMEDAASKTQANLY